MSGASACPSRRGGSTRNRPGARSSTVPELADRQRGGAGFELVGGRVEPMAPDPSAPAQVRETTSAVVTRRGRAPVTRSGAAADPAAALLVSRSCRRVADPTALPALALAGVVGGDAAAKLARLARLTGGGA